MLCIEACELSSRMDWLGERGCVVVARLVMRVELWTLSWEALKGAYILPAESSETNSVCSRRFDLVPFGNGRVESECIPYERKEHPNGIDLR